MPGPTQYDVRGNFINKRPFTLKGRTRGANKKDILLGPG